MNLMKTMLNRLCVILQDFKLADARFGKNLLLEGTDFRLIADKDMDFVILGAWLQAGGSET